MNEITLKQANELCVRYGSKLFIPNLTDTAGVALDTLHLEPLNALRHSPEKGTCGWYIWGGEELSQAEDFFQPFCVSHLLERLPIIAPYLSLEPGWRILLAPGYEDVWYDENLITIT